MSHLKKLALGLAPLVLFSLFPILLNAQSDSGGKMMSDSGGKMTATGCLKQGTDPTGFHLMGQDGKMYELMGKGLAAHVNHTVTVTGMPMTMTPDQEKKKEMREKTEAGGATVVDMKVTGVKMVSETCQ